MTSLACVVAGRLMLSDVALLAVPLLALTAPRNPMMKAPGQVSSTSHSFAAARQTAPGLPGGCRQVVLAPSQVSVVQGSPSSRQGAPALPAGCGHVALVPVQVSSRSHSPAAARQVAPALPAGCWQVVLVPLHWSRVQGLPSSAHAAPALPTGCWQVLLVPSHWSRVQGLPSSVQAIPLAFLTSVVGQVALEPVQVSARSHSPAAARQTAPALPAGCWQVELVPLHWSRVQGLPSSVQAAFALAKEQFTLQQEPLPCIPVPRSHCSPDSTMPLPQVPEASVNVVSAVRPEGSPVAVSVNVTPRSKTSTMKSAFMKSPFASATAGSWRGGSTAGSSYRT